MHYLQYVLNEGTLNITPYYDLDKTSSLHFTIDEAVEKFRHLFFNSVTLRLRSEVEIGTSLSGGLDSSSVVAAIHHLKKTGSVHKTFTASFPGFEKDETAYATTVAKQFGLQQYFVTPSAGELAAELDRFLSAHDEPVTSSSVYAQYKVYELARQQGIKVILDGQAADEILAGYSKYIQWFLQELSRKDKTQMELARVQFHQPPFNIKNKLASKFPSWAAIVLEKKAFKKQKAIPGISREFVQENISRNSLQKPIVKSLNDILYYDVFGGNLETLLKNADRNAMAHGVEVRLPFLNHALVEFVFSLPPALKLKDSFTKYVLRKSMDILLPKDIVWRKDKIGFEPPQQQWMQDSQVNEKIHEAKKLLVKNKILDAAVLTKPVTPKAAHEADNYDWRFLSAAHLM